MAIGKYPCMALYSYTPNTPPVPLPRAHGQIVPSPRGLHDPGLAQGFDPL